MPTLKFTENLKTHVDCPDREVDGTTVQDALDHYFDEYPSVRGYVLDDQGAVRKHVAIFVGGDLLVDRQTLSDRITPATEIYVFQALSGG